MSSPLAYPIVCALLGAVLGWVPLQVHGPALEKFNPFYIEGAVAVWGFYSARLLIGVWVGLSAWPRPWWLRGPLCGLLGMLPITLVSLSVPDCGFT